MRIKIDTICINSKAKKFRVLELQLALFHNVRGKLSVTVKQTATRLKEDYTIKQQCNPVAWQSINMVLRKALYQRIDLIILRFWGPPPAGL